MNFDFSDDLKQLRDQARRFLAEQSPPKVVRQVLEGGEPYASKLWLAMAEAKPQMAASGNGARVALEPASPEATAAAMVLAGHQPKNLA